MVICAQSVWLLIIYRTALLSRYLLSVCGLCHSVMYLERSVRGAKDPYGSFALSHTTLGMLLIHGSFALSHTTLVQKLVLLITPNGVDVFRSFRLE